MVDRDREQLPARAGTSRFVAGLPREGTPAQPAPHWPITRPDPGCANAPTTTWADHTNPSAFDIRDTVWSEAKRAHPPARPRDRAAGPARPSPPRGHART